MLKQRVPTRERHIQQYERLSALWQEQGLGQAENTLPMGGSLLRFTTDSGWQGVIDVVAWFGAVAPDLAAQASQAWSLPQLITLFENSNLPLDTAVLPEMLHYQRIVAQGLLSDDNAEPTASFHRFTDKHGDIWFCGMEVLPEYHHCGEHVDAALIPLTLNFRIGLSTLSYQGIRSLQPGDALLIQRQVSDIVIDCHKIGHFIHHEEGIMFEEAEQTETQTTEHDSGEIHHSEQIPVTLDFIFQQKSVTVGELAAIYQGSIMKCDPQAVNNIIVRANGLAIANGQLVWFEDCPAVEITKINPEVSSGKQ
ncbi:FliM/FliN family flagellar motor switch protein [Serratia silvae]|uniref:Surface presentation of antigens protein SpaO n=1 Tax=Serratia silvae TaxID=2824122 RepID=A0ABT0K9S7_9GAMM|nr:FliM/FliN family flagellar motor switch protein [Serratia silvae]MCL1028793.1 FliM/FliN family flagellar motor switch protein [Serratia silvae]